MASLVAAYLGGLSSSKVLSSKPSSGSDRSQTEASLLSLSELDPDSSWSSSRTCSEMNGWTHNGHTQKKLYYNISKEFPIFRAVIIHCTCPVFGGKMGVFEFLQFFII